jgi:hypothetical protein
VAEQQVNIMNRRGFLKIVGGIAAAAGATINLVGSKASNLVSTIHEAVGRSWNDPFYPHERPKERFRRSLIEGEENMGPADLGVQEMTFVSLTPETKEQVIEHSRNSFGNVRLHKTRKTK